MRPSGVAGVEAPEGTFAEMLDVPAHVVSVKAKTNEGMGFVGRGEGIACLASVLLIKDEE